MKKVMIVFGTRPDAIKMCPLVNEMKKRKEIKTVVCVSAQHRELLDEVLSIFGVIPDYDLNIMSDAQTLPDITVLMLQEMKKVLEDERPDIVLVHGDTTTAFSAALICFYLGIPIAHVEAGLRSGVLSEPFPEEYNRRAISLMSSYDFAPTSDAEKNLINEGKEKERVFVTGNTIADALRITASITDKHRTDDIRCDKKLIILTTHRRENLGEPMRAVFRAVKRIVSQYSDVCFLYPVHPNPVISRIAKETLGNTERIILIDPLDVVKFHGLLGRSYMIVTDSGGIQEEATLIGKPVVVLREQTERSEGIVCGNLLMSGTDEEKVYKNIKLLLEDDATYKKMSKKCEIYGDGKASERITEIILKILLGYGDKSYPKFG